MAVDENFSLSLRNRTAEEWPSVCAPAVIVGWHRALALSIFKHAITTEAVGCVRLLSRGTFLQWPKFYCTAE